MEIPTVEFTRRVLFLSLSFFSIAASAQNQESSPSQIPRIRSEVNDVLVPVVVTDARGHHISGLKAADFHVFEDGKPERIVAFSVESIIPVPVSIDPAAAAVSGASGGSSKISTNPNDPRRTYLIIVDTLHSSFANFGRVRKVLEQFFEKEQPGDAQYAVMALGREINVVQDSTRDAAAVLGAVRASAFSRMIQDTEATNLAVAAEQFTALMRNYCSLCMCLSSANQSELGECPAAKSRVSMFLISFAERTFLLNQQFLRQLNQIVKTIGGMPTSRTIIFISDGFNRFSGRELYSILMGYGPKDSSFQFPPLDTQRELEAVLKVATKQGVRFYTIDSRGLYTSTSAPGSGFDASSSSSTHTQMDSRGTSRLAAGVPEPVLSEAMSAARESTDGLAQLARETGGLFFENSNDLMKGIRQAVADGREYYVLAYVPENNTMDGTYRKILITVKGGKWRVNAKAGYWATGNE
jgi:VWFA-related protein